MPEHDLITKEIPPPEVGVESFNILINSSAEHVILATKWIETAHLRLSIADCVRDFAVFADAEGIKVNHPEKLLGALFSLEGIRSALGCTGEQLSGFLAKEAGEEGNKSEVKATKEALTQFFNSTAPTLAQAKKAQRIYDGLLSNFLSCSSLVEFRPVYNDSRKTINGGIVTATITITTIEPEPNAEVNSISMQLDAKDITKITNELELLKSKLSALQLFVQDQAILFNPSHSLPITNE